MMVFYFFYLLQADGPRVLRCWNLMLLSWRYAGHTKYSLDIIHLVEAVKATATPCPRLAHVITWCKFVNSHGGRGNNLPVHLYNYGAPEQNPKRLSASCWC